MSLDTVVTIAAIGVALVACLRWVAAAIAQNPRAIRPIYVGSGTAADRLMALAYATFWLWFVWLISHGRLWGLP